MDLEDTAGLNKKTAVSWMGFISTPLSPQFFFSSYFFINSCLCYTFNFVSFHLVFNHF